MQLGCIKKMDLQIFPALWETAGTRDVACGWSEIYNETQNHLTR